MISAIILVTHFCVCLQEHFQIGLTEMRRHTVRWAAAFHMLGSPNKEKGESQLRTSIHTSLSWLKESHRKLSLLWFPSNHELCFKLWTRLKPSFLKLFHSVFCHSSTKSNIYSWGMENGKHACLRLKMTNEHRWIRTAVQWWRVFFRTARKVLVLVLLRPGWVLHLIQK